MEVSKILVVLLARKVMRAKRMGGLPPNPPSGENRSSSVRSPEKPRKVVTYVPGP